ncbi:MAG: transposase [Chloroflexota bacterium]
MLPPENKLPQRKSPRLEGYDYSRNGAYFVTICVQDRLHLFGTIVEQKMILNDAGVMIHHFLGEIPQKYASIEPDLFVVMPNHIHIILLKLSDDDGLSISDIIQWFKRITTNEYIEGVKNKQWKRFSRRLWQQSFHDHIIRDEGSLNYIREYVLYNPRLWEKDELNT